MVDSNRSHVIVSGNICIKSKIFGEARNVANKDVVLDNDRITEINSFRVKHLKSKKNGSYKSLSSFQLKS